jgi:hypothetical protein
MEPASFSSRLSFRLILEKVKQQPSNEMAQAAVEKIRRKSYRELKRSLDLLVLLHQGKRTENIILRITIPKEKPRIKPTLQHYPTQSSTPNSAGELKSTAERSYHDSFITIEVL